jgi:3-oxoacyl-[acyl-carrier protein] reductase
MEFDLQGKTALVTGSSGGIGRVIAQTLAAEGVKVVVHGRRHEGVEETVALIRTAHHEAQGVVGDLSQDGSAQEVATRATSAFGGIDILVNNAGTFENRHWAELQPADWLAAYNNNIVSAVRMAQQMAPAMKQRGWGRLICPRRLNFDHPCRLNIDQGLEAAARSRGCG